MKQPSPSKAVGRASPRAVPSSVVGRASARAVPAVPAIPSPTVSSPVVHGPVVSGPLLTRRDLAAHLKISVRTLDRLVAAGEIPVIRLHGLPRFSLPAVLAAL